MRKIILNLCTSLDWYIEWNAWEYDWCFTDQDYGMSEFLAWIDTIFFGRKSYELFIKDSNDLFSDKQFVVFSKSLNEKNIKIINENIFDEVIKIKNMTWKNIWLFWWANLFNTLFELKLVDELIISIHPLILWWGKTLFKDLWNRTKLKLIESKTYDTGLIQVKYEIKKDA